MVGATMILSSSFTAVAVALLVLVISRWRWCSGLTVLPLSIPPLVSPHFYLFLLLAPLWALRDGHWVIVRGCTKCHKWVVVVKQDDKMGQFVLVMSQCDMCAHI